MIFLWLMLQNRVLTVDNLMLRWWTMVNRCCMCRRAMETVRHLFQECQFTAQVRSRIQKDTMHFSYTEQFKQGKYRGIVLQSNQMALRRLQLVLLFVIWRERCQRTCTEKRRSPVILADEVLMKDASWFQVHWEYNRRQKNGGEEYHLLYFWNFPLLHFFCFHLHFSIFLFFICIFELFNL